MLALPSLTLNPCQVINPETGQPLPKEEIKAHLKFLIVASQETTSHTGALAATMIALHPEVQVSVERELEGQVHGVWECGEGALWLNLGLFCNLQGDLLICCIAHRI
jgi:hypothetical protein